MQVVPRKRARALARKRARFATSAILARLLYDPEFGYVHVYVHEQVHEFAHVLVHLLVNVPELSISWIEGRASKALLRFL